jgi:hypothetical protein
MDPDQLLFGRAVGRILRWMSLISAGGGILGFLLGGWRWAAGFLAGALASYLNFRWLKQLVEALGTARPRKRLAVFLGLRYLLFGLGAYAILNYSPLSLTAALVGALVPAAAVIIEILFELVYAGT